MLRGCLSVAHVTEAFAGGVTTYMTLVLPQLAARGHDVTLYCCNSRDERRFANAIETISKAGVKIKTLPMRRSFHLWADASAVFHLCRELKSSRYDLVHTHGTKAGLLGRLAARLGGVPAVHTPHCYAFLRAETRAKSLFIRMAERVMSGSTSGLIAVSESERQTAIKHGLVDSLRCTVVSNGMPIIDDAPDRILVRKTLGLPQSSFVVTMATRLVDYKGIELFLDVATLCRDMDVVFTIAGSGELEDWAMNHVASRNLSNQVRVLGHVMDVPSLLGGSDLCVLCSKAEGQPYTLLEAMRGGCPIVATAVPGITDMLENGKTAILVTRDVQQIATAIRQLAGDEAMRKSLSAQARDRFLAAHLLERQADALVEAYERFSRIHK